MRRRPRRIRLCEEERLAGPAANAAAGQARHARRVRGGVPHGDGQLLQRARLLHDGEWTRRRRQGRSASVLIAEKPV